MSEQDCIDGVLAAATSWASAFNSGDAPGCASHYLPGATMRAEPFGEFTGRDAIQGFWQNLIDQGFSNVRYLGPSTKVASNDTVILDSPWAMNKARGFIHREEWAHQSDNSWKLRHDHFEVLDQLDSVGKPAKVLLVHGAWAGAWCWQHVVAALHEKNIAVETIDLPAHGENRNDPIPQGLDDYANAVVSVLDQQTDPVILLGHSFGGQVVAQAAEYRPEKVLSLVYLAAFLLPSGTSFMDATQGVETSDVLNNLAFNEGQSLVTIKDEAAHNAIAADVPMDAFMAAAPYMVPEPTAPLGSPLKTSAKKWGRIPRRYIYCTEDRAIPLNIQQGMAGSVVLDKTYTLATSHCPMFSAPQDTADIIAEIAQE